MAISVIQIGNIDGASSLASATNASKIQLFLTEDLNQAIEIIASKNIDMAFVNSTLDLPALFTKLNDNKINCPVVACGPAQPVQNAVKAVRMGAIEFLPTPLDTNLIASLLETLTPADEGFTPIFGDPKMEELLLQAKQFAASNASILLRGESGTGKEVFSKYIHLNSPRKTNEFIAVNCAAIPENLLESELFGHEKGAFSGAVSKRLGKFQQADGGTLLLDEISEMDLSLQAKLLRAIQERVVDPVGSSSSVPVDIRLIATTNRNLEEYVAEGSFREDLYFRLNVVMLEIPALRERTGDIPPLANHFANLYAKQNNLENITISESGMEKLIGCYWKGNVRELENTIHRAVLMMGSNTEMLPEHIVLSPMSLQKMDVADNNEQAADSASRTIKTAAAQAYASAGSSSATGFIGKSLQDVEKNHILTTLTYCRGNREHAADVLGISIKILKEKLDNYDTV